MVLLGTLVPSSIHVNGFEKALLAGTPFAIAVRISTCLSRGSRRSRWARASVQYAVEADHSECCGDR